MNDRIPGGSGDCGHATTNTLRLDPISNASHAGFGPLPSLASAGSQNQLDRFFGHMEVLAGAWDVPVATLASAIREAKKGNYAPLGWFVLPRLFVGVLAVPSLGRYLTELARMLHLRLGATETVATQSLTHPRTGKAVSITIRKFRLVEEGRETLIYHAIYEDGLLLRQQVPEHLSVQAFEESFWVQIVERLSKLG